MGNLQIGDWRLPISVKVEKSSANCGRNLLSHKTYRRRQSHEQYTAFGDLRQDAGKRNG